MKRLIIGLALLSLIFCSNDSCDEESDKTKCSTIAVEYEGFSCYPFSWENDEETGCSVFPDSENSQKAFLNLANGMMKEIYSSYPSVIEEDETEDIEQIYTEKETYNKGEEIVVKSKNISKSDLDIVYSKSTCTYYYYGRIFDYLEEISYDFTKYKGYPNITDKNVCFNAKQFPELKDLIDCGYAVVKYNNGRTNYEIKTCFYIPNNKMPEDIGKFLKDEFIDPIFGEEGMLSIIMEMSSQHEDLNDDDNRRLLSSSNSYEVEVEDKNGKKIKWTDSSKDIIVIEKGSNSNILLLNLILLLSLILLY